MQSIYQFVNTLPESDFLRKFTPVVCADIFMDALHFGRSDLIAAQLGKLFAASEVPACLYDGASRTDALVNAVSHRMLTIDPQTYAFLSFQSSR